MLSRIGIGMQGTKDHFLIGKTGSGKSMTGCMLVKDGNAFPLGHDGFSKTKKTKGLGGVVDTPGLGDSNGETIALLDDIVEHLRANRNVGSLVLVMNSSEKLDPVVQNSLTLFKHCFRENIFSECGVPRERLVVVLNKVPRSGGTGMFANLCSDAEELKQNNLEIIKTCLGIEPLDTNIVVIHHAALPGDAQQVQEIEALQTILANINALDPFDTSKMRLFAKGDNSVLKDADVFLNQSIHEKDSAAMERKSKGDDINWHGKRIEDCSIAVKCLSWIPFVGPVCCIGFEAAIADSKHKIPILQGELAEIENDLAGSIQRGLVKAQQLRDECERLKQSVVVAVSD